MKITKVAGVNLKGKTFSHDLGPITMITGKGNFIGKTARLDAIVLGISGYLPRLGKQNNRTFSLASAKSMSVGIETDTGIRIGRTWTKTGKNIELDTVFTGTDEAKWKIPPVALDAKEYFNLGEKDRTRMIFSMLEVDKAKASGSAINEKFKLLADNEELKGTEEVRAMVADIINEITQEVEVIEQAALREELRPQEWIEELIATMKEKKLEAERAVKRNVGTVQYMTENQEGENIPMNNAANLQEYRDILQEHRTKKADLERRIREDNQKVADRSLAEDATVKAAALQLEIEKLEAEENALQQELDAYESQTVKLTEAYGTAKKDLEVLNTRINMMIHTLKEMETAFEREQAKEKCPCCDGSDEWKERHRKKYDRERKKIEKTKAEAITTRDHLQTNAANIVEALEKSKAEDTRLRNLAALARTKGPLVNNKKAELQNCRNVITKAESLQIMTAAEMEKALYALRDTEQAITKATTSINEAQDKENKRIAYMERKRAHLEAKRKAERVEAEAVIYKGALGILEELQADLVKDAFKQVLKRANELAAPILGMMLAFKDGEIGKWVDGTFVTTETFSGAETVMTYAAISIALAVDSPIRCVFMDEMGNLSTDNAIELIDLADALIQEGRIDQFIGVDLKPELYRNRSNIDLIEL
jgi:hypothetical protein